MPSFTNDTGETVVTAFTVPAEDGTERTVVLAPGESHEWDEPVAEPEPVVEVEPEPVVADPNPANPDEA